MASVAILMANGCEPIEALAPADALRRVGVEVSLVTLNSELHVDAAHGVGISCDAQLDSFDFSKVDMLVLPGGMPGTKNLRESSRVCELVAEFTLNKKIAAICAAPSILAELGLLDGRVATCYPGFETDFPEGVRPEENGVYVSGNMVTASGPGFALPFGFELIRQLVGPDAADSVADGMLY